MNMEGIKNSKKSWVILTLLILVTALVVGGVFVYGNYYKNKAEPITVNKVIEKKVEEKEEPTYVVVDTGQGKCYDDEKEITCPTSGPFSGQDASYKGNQPKYKDNGDGTVTDLNTGLMWQQDPGAKVTYPTAVAGASSFTLAGRNDWRMPTIKELYSLIDFGGINPTMESKVEDVTPFIDTTYFSFRYGDPKDGDRMIDSQWATSAVYKPGTMNGQECFFGVNFADGRIKCYPTSTGKGYYAIYVRGDAYGVNSFTDNGDSTISDKATGLMWTKEDSGKGVLWKDALAYCEDLKVVDKSDWRLPNVKELHSILDYTRSPDTTSSAAIDPVFNVTQIENELGEKDYGFYWSSTTHVRDPDVGSMATYVSFGRALGYMKEFGGWVDVHGAGAQRSDPKAGVAPEHALGFGPQGDARRAYNYVRCVR